jgi:hypothetical protein
MWEPYPLGNLRVCPGLSWDCFTFYIIFGGNLPSYKKIYYVWWRKFW